jgi:hypothetical protein
MDQQYLKNAQTAGIYECYCSSQVSVFTFYANIYKRNNQFCSDYLLAMNGGSLITLPQGICNGFFNNLGAILIIKLVRKIGFHNYHTE